METIRHHYDHVNFVVPNYAFSAGTVLVMSGDCIYMDYYSRLGPIDPQIEIEEGHPVPALGYLVQWNRLVEKARRGEITPAEIHLMVTGFDQAALYQYEQARELSVTLLREWLVSYKFKNWTRTQTRGRTVTPAMRRRRAERIARSLNDTEKWHSHGHGISMEILRRDLNLQIDDFGGDPELSGKVRQYDSLFNDYMSKRGLGGSIHAMNVHIPLMYG